MSTLWLRSVLPQDEGAVAASSGRRPNWVELLLNFMSNAQPGQTTSISKPSDVSMTADEVQIGPTFLIADDQPLFRDGLRLLLRELNPKAEIAEAATLDDAMRAAQGARDLRLVVLEVALPGSQSFGGFERLQTLIPATPIVLLSSTHDDGRIMEALRKGARGYLIRSSSREVIRLALSLVLAGETYIPADVIADIAQHPSSVPPSQPAEARNNTAIGALTPRQREVLQFLLDGLPNKAIGLRLGLDETTVKSHVRQVMRKLGVHNRTQAVLLAMQLGLRPEGQVAP